MEKLQVNIVIEILGRPKEHVVEALNSLIEKLGGENGIKIIKKTIHEPIQVKESNDLFTSFSEATLELDNLYNYFGLLFGYMPSHIEIVHPEKIPLTNFDLNDFGNKLIQRLHEYDAITKRAMVEKNIIIEKLQKIAPDVLQEIFGENKKSEKNSENKLKKKLR